MKIKPVRGSGSCASENQRFVCCRIHKTGRTGVSRQSGRIMFDSAPRI